MYFPHLKLLGVFAKLNEKIMKKFSVQIFTHLIQNKPIPDRAVMNVRLDPNRILLVLKVSEEMIVVT